jgi:hypothetical protein
MTNLEELRRRLQHHKRDCRDLPACSEIEEERRNLQEKLFLFQIQCEQWKQEINIAFGLCTTKIVSETVGNLTVEKYRTEFKWEPIRDQFIEDVTKKELIGIEYLQSLYNKTFQDEQQRIQQ